MCEPGSILKGVWASGWGAHGPESPSLAQLYRWCLFSMEPSKVAIGSSYYHLSQSNCATGPTLVSAHWLHCLCCLCFFSQPLASTVEASFIRAIPHDSCHGLCSPKEALGWGKIISNPGTAVLMRHLQHNHPNQIRGSASSSSISPCNRWMAT